MSLDVIIEPARDLSKNEILVFKTLRIKDWTSTVDIIKSTGLVQGSVMVALRKLLARGYAIKTPGHRPVLWRRTMHYLPKPEEKLKDE